MAVKMREPGGFRARLGAVVAATLVLGGATVATVGGFTPAPAGAQMADHATALPGLMDSMLVDAASGHVFVPVPDAGDVVVFDMSGAIVKTITGEAGARGLAVLNGQLYVVAASADAVDAFNASTLARVGTLASGFAGMTGIATADGAVWVAPSDGLLWRIEADGSTTSFADPLPPGSGLGTELVSDVASPKKLLVFLDGGGGMRSRCSMSRAQRRPCSRRPTIPPS